MLREKARKLFELCKDLEAEVRDAREKAVIAAVSAYDAWDGCKPAEEKARAYIEVVKDLLRDVHAKIENYFDEIGESVELVPREEGGEER